MNVFKQPEFWVMVGYLILASLGILPANWPCAGVVIAGMVVLRVSDKYPL